MTSSIQPISNHRFSDSAYVVYNSQTPAPRHSQAYPEYNSRARNESRDPREYVKDSRDNTRHTDHRDKARHADMYAVPQRTHSDSTGVREKWV